MTDDPYRDLVVALFLLAIEDIRRGNEHAADARVFLAGEWAAWLAEEMGIDPQAPGRLASQETVPQVPAGFVTYDQAAEILGGGRREVARLMLEGILHPVGSRRRDHRRLFDRDEIERAARWREAA